MGYRGEDASRRHGDRGQQPPWQDNGDAGYGQPEHGKYDDYGQAGGYGDPSGYGHPGYEQPGYEQPGYDQGYDTVGGGYQDGSYPGQDAGNDWYGGQPAAASGASFADTGAFTLSGRIDDEYGTGPSRALRDPIRGYPPSTGPDAGRTPPALPRGRRALPAPTPTTASGPMASGPMASGPMSMPHTGQQERYDGYDPRPAPGNGTFDDYDAHGGYDGQNGYAGPDSYAGPDGYAGPGGYDGPGYDGPGYDGPGYDDYASDADPYRDRDDRADTGGRPRRAAKTDSADRPRRGAPRGKRLLLLAAGAVAAVIIAVIVAGAVYGLVLRTQSPASGNTGATGPLPTPGTKPSTQACVKQFGQYCHIEQSTDDPAPLTVSELFPPAFANEADKNSFSLASTKLDKKCANAVIGADLITQLKDGKCTQVLRASYLSGNGKIMGTVGVVNLASTNQAHHAGKVVGQNDFIAPLAAAKGVASKLGKGTGVVEAEYKGHYLILTWSEFINGTTPKTKAQDAQLEQFSNDLIAGTANISLSQRMVTGAPASPGAAS